MESLRVLAPDESGELVKYRFINFLETHRSIDDVEDNDIPTQQR